MRLSIRVIITDFNAHSLRGLFSRHMKISACDEAAWLPLHRAQRSSLKSGIFKCKHTKASQNVLPAWFQHTCFYQRSQLFWPGPPLSLDTFCLILRRINKNFGKGVDSFGAIPIMPVHTAGVISSAGRAPPLQGGGRRFDPVITHQQLNVVSAVLSNALCFSSGS